MEIRDRASPISEIQAGPLSIAVEIDAEDAAWLVQQARLHGVTPEAIVEQLVASAARRARTIAPPSA